MYSVELFVLLHGLRATLLRRSLTVHRTNSTDANGTRPSFCRSSSRTDFPKPTKKVKDGDRENCDQDILPSFAVWFFRSVFERSGTGTGLHVCSKWAESSVRCETNKWKTPNRKIRICWIVTAEEFAPKKKWKGKKGMRRGLCATKNSIRFYVWFGKSVNRFASSTHYSPVEIDI